MRHSTLEYVKTANKDKLRRAPGLMTEYRLKKKDDASIDATLRPVTQKKRALQSGAEVDSNLASSSTMFQTPKIMPKPNIWCPKKTRSVGKSSQSLVKQPTREAWTSRLKLAQKRWDSCV
jgi:hypothetical protein